jgi:hypothetical protein
MFTERTEVTMKLTRSHRTVCAGVGLAITVVVAAAPAARADGGGDTLAAVSAATPDTVAAAAAVPTTSAGETAIDATLDGTDVTVPVDPANGITIASEQNSVSIDLPFAADAEDATLERRGVVAYDNGNGSTTVPVVRHDGSVQINTVIEDSSAPTRYEYVLELPAGVVIQEAGGTLLLVAADGSLVGGVAPSWAKDARGSDVASRYEVNGKMITQVIEHDDRYVYPVVGDPWIGMNLFGAMSKDTFNGKPKYSGVLSAWGTSVYSGLAQGGGIGAAAAGQAILRDAGWTEWKSRLVGSNPAATLKQQYDCHVAGGYAVWLSGAHWDLEAARSSNPNWLNNVFGHKCNW